MTPCGTSDPIRFGCGSAALGYALLVQDWETVEYIHMNPVRQGLARQAGDWKWSSYQECAGVSAAEQQERCGLVIDRVRLPADENAGI